MATPADQRLLELLDKWLKSLELHVKYSTLDDDSYRQIQPWVEHQRPSRWIIDLARQKALALQTQVQERIKMGDVKFSDSLELMTFLANLVGAEHIERFIPVADASTERAVELAPPDSQTQTLATALTGTREMPKFVGGKQPEAAPAGSPTIARSERKAAAAKSTGKPAAKAQGKAIARPNSAPPAHSHAVPAAASAAPPERHAIADAVREQVIADAARLVQWGRKWYELAELIARMADRPSLTDVRRILKDNKTLIDQRAGRS